MDLKVFEITQLRNIQLQQSKLCFLGDTLKKILSRLLDKASICYNLSQAIFSQVSGGSKLANSVTNETS